jgi:hypothetical protein
MWKSVLDPDRPQMAVRPMRYACWIFKATNTHSECVILIAFPLQQWLHERASMLGYTYSTACLVFVGIWVFGLIWSNCLRLKGAVFCLILRGFSSPE